MVVTVVGCSGGASGGGFGEHGGDCPLVTGELGEAAPDACFAVWVQPATPATRTAAIAAGRIRRNFQADIGVTVLGPISFLKSLVQRVRAPGFAACASIWIACWLFAAVSSETLPDRPGVPSSRYGHVHRHADQDLHALRNRIYAFTSTTPTRSSSTGHGQATSRSPGTSTAGPTTQSPRHRSAPEPGRPQSIMGSS